MACLLLLASCEDLGTSYPGSLFGTFAYRAFDTLKVEVERGTLALYGSDSTVTGHWRFEDGRSGELEGIAGSWEQIGFAGVLARGPFVAVRMP